MKALVFNPPALSLCDVPRPVRKKNEVLIRIQSAGICSTDLEILRGYVPGFSGIAGHEFVGAIEEADDASMVGQRATAEINCACGKPTCEFCAAGLARHCPSRTVVGIADRPGAFAQFIAVPAENVVVIPGDIPGSSAIFIEPLAAALEIFDQVAISEAHSSLLIGDGRLAQLIALAFGKKELPLAAVGRHADKLGATKAGGADTFLEEEFTPRGFDVVIEASGSPAGFSRALACVKPRGTVVLKSTYAAGFDFNPAGVVVNEVTIVGSRCGRFEEALRFLRNFRPDLSPLITARYPFSRALEAFERVRQKDALKVVLDMEEDRDFS